MHLTAAGPTATNVLEELESFQGIESRPAPAAAPASLQPSAAPQHSPEPPVPGSAAACTTRFCGTLACALTVLWYYFQISKWPALSQQGP